MVRFPQFVLRRPALRQGQSANHPDADLLTAFGEQRLSARERSDLLAHLAQCPECREVLALSSAAEESESVCSVSPVKIAPRHWRLLYWTLPAALTCLLLGIVWGPSLVRKPLPPAPVGAIATNSKAAARVDTLSKPKESRAAASPSEVPRKAPQVHIRRRITTPPAPIPVQPAPAPPPSISNPLAEAKATATTAPFEDQASTMHAFFQPQQVEQAPTAAPVPRRTMARAMPSSLIAPLAIIHRGKSLWSLDTSPAAVGTNGTIQKSNDGGKTWQNVRVDDRARLYALSADGANVWVGGANGALFHSADDGLHWSLVMADDGGIRLSGTITGIDLLGGDSIRLRVQSGGAWLTNDGGLHWRRY